MYTKSVFPSSKEERNKGREDGREGGRKEGNWFNISKVATYLRIKYKYQKSELSVLSQNSIRYNLKVIAKIWYD